MMKTCYRTGYAVMFSLLFFCVSCGDLDLFDTDKWSDKIEGWEPNLTAPIAHGSFSMWDLLLDTANSNIGKEATASGDSVLFVRYTKENIYKLDDISTIFDMPAQDLQFNVTSILLPAVTVPADGILPEQTLSARTITLEEIQAPVGCRLNWIKVNALDEAKWSVTFPCKNFSYELTYEFWHIKTGSGENFKNTFQIPAGPEGTYYSANGLLGDVTILCNSALVEVTGRIPSQPLAAGTEIAGELSGEINLSDIKFSVAEGEITKEPFNIDVEDLSLDGIDFLDELGGTFTFAEPVLRLVSHNKGIGVPVNLDATMSAGTKILELNQGYKLELKGNGTDILRASFAEFNSVNSTISSFLSSPVPTGNITCVAKLGVLEDTDRIDTIRSDGSISLDAEIKIPLKLKAESLSYRDTIADIDLADADKIISGTITIVAENGIPLELEIPELTLLDEQYQSIGSIKKKSGEKNVIGAGPLNGKGTTHGELVFNLEKENIDALAKSKHIFLNVVAKTNEVVSLRPNARLTFKLIVSAKTDLSKLDF